MAGTYIKSDTGFIRILPVFNAPAHSLGTYYTADKCGQVVFNNPAPTYADFVLSVSPQNANTSCGVSKTDINAQAVGHVWTLWGFNIYNSQGSYINKQLRFVLKKQNVGGNDMVWLGIQRYDVANSTVEQEKYFYSTRQIEGTSFYTAHFVNLEFLFAIEQKDNADMFVFATCFEVDNMSTVGVYGPYIDCATMMGMLQSGQHVNITPTDDPNEQDPGGPSGPGGGGGDHDPTPDPVPLPDQTGLDNLGCGFVNYFRVTMAEVINLANDVYSDNIWQQIRNYFTHPSDMIAGLFMLPITPPVGASFKPQVGPVTFNHWFPLITQQYVEAHCGTLYIAEYFGSCFDYSPYSSIDIYLPFIGMRSLDVDEVMGKYVKVEYKVDVTNGDCIAFILVGEDALTMGVRYQFSGNCAMQIPVSTANMDSVIQNAVSFATTAVATIATAGVAGGAAGTAALAAGASEADAALISASAQSAANWEAAGDIGASAISAVMGAKPTVERSGCNGSALGFMGVLYPFIIRRTPRQSLPDGYKNLSGYPSNISGTIGSFSGLTIVETVRLQGIPGTDNEIAEIEKLLRGGVIV